jgi:hypothetical protein
VLGPFVDDTDGKTAETGLTISQADIRLSKNGGAFAQTNNATGATHDEKGYYGVPLDTTDTATLGRLRVSVSESGALPVWADYMVVPAAVYDSLVAGTDYLQADAVQISGGSTAADNLEAACDGTGYNLGGGDVVAASVTGNVGGNVTGSIGSLATQAKADVNAEADTALSDVGLTSTVTGRIDAAVTSRSSHSAADVKTAVEAAGSHLTLIKAQTDDLANGERLDLIFDAILEDTGTTLDGIVDAILADTNELQTNQGDWATATGFATPTNVTDAVTAIRGATETETLDTLAADIAAVSAGGGLDAAGVREALGMSAADMDDQLDAILDATEAVSVELTEDDVEDIVDGVVAGIAGTGTVYVDHDTLDDDGDDMAFLTSGGAGIGGATVTAYVATEYAAGTYTSRGSTTTLDNGDWASPLRLNDGVQYIIEFDRDGYEKVTTTVTPEA